MNALYKAAYGRDGKWYVDGPARAGECSYYGGTLYPGFRFDCEDSAERAAKIANLAHEQGRLAAQAAIRKALGVSV